MTRLARSAAASAAAALTLALAGCAGTKVWMRSATTAVETDGAESACAEYSEGGGRGTVAYGAGSYDVTVGGGSGSGFAPPMDNFSQKSACMRNQGFRLVAISDDEDKQLRALSGEARDQYWRELLQKHGLKPAVDAPPAPVPAQPAPRR